MAACHAPSNCFPSRSHSVTAAIEEQLYKLKALQSSSISHKLSVLKELYMCVDDFLQLPYTQQTLFNEQQSECVEEVLNGSLRMLDTCATKRDVLSQIKECIQQLQFCLQRRQGRESSLKNEIDAYIASRNKLNKVISKSLGNLKKKEKNLLTACFDSSFNLLNLITILRGVKEISLAVSESVLASISLPKEKAKSPGWSTVSKLLQCKRVSCKGDVNANAAERIDAEILVLKSCKAINCVQVKSVLKGLDTLESSIQEVEEELECVYRQFVKTRVSLLNIPNH